MYSCAHKVQEEPESIVSGSSNQVHQGHVEYLSAIYQVSALFQLVLFLAVDLHNRAGIKGAAALC